MNEFITESDTRTPTIKLLYNVRYDKIEIRKGHDWAGKKKNNNNTNIRTRACIEETLVIFYFASRLFVRNV